MSTEAILSPTDLPSVDLPRADLPIEGMTCSACAIRLEKALTRAAGITDAAVNFAVERAAISFDPDQTSVGAIADLIGKAGPSCAIATSTCCTATTADASPRVIG